MIAQARARRRSRRTGWRRAQELAGLQDGDGMEGRASRCIPSTARCRWSGTCRRCRRSSRRPTPARSAATARCRTCSQLRIPVKYLANLLTAGDEAPVALRARAHARHARLHAGEDRRRRHRRGDRRAGRAHRRADRGHVPDHGDRQLRGPLRDSRPRTASSARTPSTCAASCGFSFGNGCSDGRTETDLFGAPSASGASTPMEFVVMRRTFKVALGAARLSDGRAAGRRSRDAAPRSTPRRGCRRRAATALDRLLDEIADRRPLRPAGALRAAVRPHALAVAAPVRARARRKPRPRPGDGRPQGALRAARPVHRARASCRTTCRCSWSSCRRSRRPKRATCSPRRRTFSRPSAERLKKRKVAVLGRVLLRAGAGAGQAVERDRRGADARSRTRTPTTSRRSMRPGRRRRSPSAPARRRLRNAARTAWPPSCVRPAASARRAGGRAQASRDHHQPSDRA